MSFSPEPKSISPQENKQTGLSYRVVDGEELVIHLEQIATNMSKVASDGFGGGKVITPERMKERLALEPYVVLAEEGTEVVGFQFQSIHETDTERYIYYARAIRKDHQRRGIAQNLLNRTIEHYQPTIIGARSQNPGEMLSFLHTMRRRGVTSVYPFNVNANQAAELQQTLVEFSQHISFTDLIQLETGLMPSSYKEGKLGDYQIDMTNPQVERLEEYLASIGFDRYRGDAVFYFARVNPSRGIDTPGVNS